MDCVAPTHPHIDLFWNSRPPNGAFHQVTRPHHWQNDAICKLSLQEIARLGENVTARWAEVAGWHVLERQKRNRGFELDLVLRRGPFLRVVEVKTRVFPEGAPDMSTTEAWLGFRKRKALQRGVHFILRGLGPEAKSLSSIACDLVAVDILKTRQVSLYRWPDAFPLGGE
jgi:Holliday junction resolvase-like predicted endonuclease